LKIKKTITLGLLFVLFLNFFTNITIGVYNSIDDGSFDTEATVESSPSSGTLTSVSSGSFDTTVVVEQTFGNMVVNSSGSWDTTVYIEYLVYSDWSPWWIMFYNSTPAISSPSPSNGSTNQPLNLTWSIDINNPDGNDFNWSIECSNGQSNSSNNDNNGTKNLSLTNLLNATTYTVWVNATSVVNNTLSSSEWYTFTTQVGTNAPVVTTGNATDITNNSATLHGNLVDDGGEPCTVWFKYGYTTNYGNTTSNQSMTSGVFSQEITSLNSGKLYHYKAFANNSFGTVNGTDKVFLTLPDNPTNVYANTTGFYNITLSWSKNSNRTVILRDNVEIYNGTGNSYKDDNLDVNTTYTYMVYSLATWTYNGTTYYQQSSGVQVSNTTFYVSPPYNQSYDLNSTTGLLNISWSRGNRSDREVVVKKTTGYPSSVGDGTIVQNSTNTFYTETVSDFAYYSIFSYNESANIYSDPLHAVWGAVSINVYKESEPSISITNYTTFVKNQDGSETFYQANCNNPLFIGVSDMPNGADITIQISKDGYHTRTQIMDIYENYWYQIKFYLAPDTEGGGDEGSSDYVPPSSEETELKTNTTSVSNPDNDATVVLECVPEKIVSVYGYNESLYGHWYEIPSDKYVVNGNTVVINSSMLDENTTLVKVSYYCTVAEEYASQYLFSVVGAQSEYGSNIPIDTAHVVIKRYFNDTGSYETIYSVYTDSNGQVSVWLIPGVLYQVMISKTGYETEILDLEPRTIQYADDWKYTFRLSRSSGTWEEPEYLMKNITWSVEPLAPIHYSGFTIWFNITSSDNKLEWFSMRVLYYNTTNNTWVVLFYNKTYSSSGGSINYTIPNVTGRYSIECWFKKQGYEPYEVLQEGSIITFIEKVKKGLEDFPDFAYFVVLLIIMVMVMGFFMIYFSTGIITGYIGLGVMAIGLLLKGVTIGGVSGWMIFFVTFVLYTMGVFLWSRL